MTTALPVAGLHHAKLPVNDLARSRQWFESLLGLQTEIEFRDDRGTVRGVAYLPLSGLRIALREDPRRAAALAGWDPLALAVPTRAGHTGAGWLKCPGGHGRYWPPVLPVSERGPVV